MYYYNFSIIQKKQRPHNVNVYISACERPWLEQNPRKAINALKERKDVKNNEAKEINREIADWKMRQAI